MLMHIMRVSLKGSNLELEYMLMHIMRVGLKGSNLELEYMLMHIMRVGLKGSNFQGWPLSLPVQWNCLGFFLD